MTSIGRDDGIHLCLSCKFPECIGDENCHDLLTFIKTEESITNKRKKRRVSESNRVLKDIAFMLEEKEENYLLTGDIKKQLKVNPNLIFSLIRQGKIKTEMSNISLRPNLRGRGNKIMIVDIELFE